MEALRTNFNKVYDELSKTIKKTHIAKGMGYTTTRQLDNTSEGKADISTKALVALIENFNVNPNFLHLGQGQMFRNGKESQNECLTINYSVTLSL